MKSGRIEINDGRLFGLPRSVSIRRPPEADSYSTDTSGMIKRPWLSTLGAEAAGPKGYNMRGDSCAASLFA